MRNYEPINPPGFLKHKKTGRYYCQKCLIEKHLESELSVISKEEFKCRVCNEPYKIDPSILISDNALSKAWDKAVQELIIKDK